MGKSADYYNSYWSCEESSKNRGKTGDNKNAMPGDKRSRPGKNQ